MLLLTAPLPSLLSLTAPFLIFGSVTTWPPSWPERTEPLASWPEPIVAGAIFAPVTAPLRSFGRGHRAVAAASAVVTAPLARCCVFTDFLLSGLRRAGGAAQRHEQGDAGDHGGGVQVPLQSASTRSSRLRVQARERLLARLGQVVQDALQVGLGKAGVARSARSSTRVPKPFSAIVTSTPSTLATSSASSGSDFISVRETSIMPPASTPARPFLPAKCGERDPFRGENQRASDIDPSQVWSMSDARNDKRGRQAWELAGTAARGGGAAAAAGARVQHAGNRASRGARAAASS